MPYQRNRDLPAGVRLNIPSKSGKDLFRRVVNAQLTDDKSESSAFRSAWAALRRAGYRKNPNGKWVKKMDLERTAAILKADSEQRIVWGWASVVTEKGEPVVDSQGDSIAPEEMEKAANAFMQDARIAKAMHEGDGVGEVIHSLPLTKELGEALGIQSDKEGWIIAMKIHDDAVWQRVKSGELQAFSIGGQAQSEEYDA